MTLEQTLSKLISFATVTGNKREVERLFDWIEKELQPVPVYVKKYEKGDFPTLLITPTRSRCVKMWLVAHVDVVPAPEHLFKASKKGNRLYGRGAIDMKFAVACYMHLLRELNIAVKKYDIGVMLTSDEEWGGDSGVKHMLGQKGVGGDIAFLPDGSGVWEVEERAKGKVLVSARAKGISEHGSRPWMGRNAIQELCNFLNNLNEVFLKFEKGKEDTHWHATLNVGTIEGGTLANVVANNARAMLDIRYTTVQEWKAIQSAITALKRTYPSITTKYIFHDAPYGINKTNKYAKQFMDVAKEMYDIDCGWARAHGASDARFFNERGIPTVLISPKGGASHSDKEWIDVKDLERYYNVLKRFVQEVAKK